MRTPIDPATPLRSRSLRFLLVATVGGFSGYALLLPVVPLWAVAGGAGETAAGATNAVFMLVTVLTQLAMPWALTRIDVRGLFAAGTVLIGAPTPLYALSSELWMLLAVSALRGVGFGLLTVTGSALVAELVPVAQRGRAAGLYGLAIGLPNVVLLPAGVWLSEHIGFAPLFWGAGVLPVVAAASVLGIAQVHVGAPEHGERPTGMVALLPWWVVMVVVTASAGGLTAFVSMAIDPTLASLALLAFGGAGMIGRWAAGRLGDRFGQRGVLAPSIIIGAVGFALLAVAAWLSGPVALVGAALFGLGFGAVQNTTLVLMLERVDSGSASTAWNIAFDGGQGLGAIGFGALISGLGFSPTFALAAALILASRFVMGLRVRL
ncbi:MFS transporter [Saccharopolyspora griseoalba]|uniref:MFS transporter n=1 Tax=Saccharopolyspora griseoalba TaxID=1431848 RepID=A0ABW2LEU2_9PSEU